MAGAQMDTSMEEALERVKPVERPSLEDILLADHAAREAVRCAR